METPPAERRSEGGPTENDRSIGAGRQGVRRLLTRRRVLTAAAASFASLGAYAWRIEPRWIETVRRSLPIANLPEGLDGATLVQLSDLHVGPHVEDAYIERVFDLVRSVSPEIVVYTGDFVSYDTNVKGNAANVLARPVLGRKGTFGVLGNHDYGGNWRDSTVADRVTKLMEEGGVRILRNEVAECEGLAIGGLDDLWSRRFQPDAVLPALGKQPARLALVHNPDAADRKGWQGYSGWILAGHTHGGQCKPPFLPPPLLPVRNRRYTAGDFDLTGDRRLYISRGVGHTFRVRFNVRPEITLFRLESAPRVFPSEAV